MNLRRLGPLLGIGLGLLPLAGLVLWIGLRASLPQTRGRVLVAGLEQEAQIVRDAAGLPHIHAATDADAVFALGYAHAQDRLWQMEMNRRIAAGRLSEVFGEATLDTDRFLRTLGLQRAAEASLEHLLPETIQLLEAYAAGVNAFLEADPRLPPEFLVLGVEPEPWRPAHSLGWAKMMSWDLARDWDLELLRLQLARRLGDETRAAELLPSVPADGATILDEARLPSGTVEGLLALDGHLRRRYRLRGLDVGSNSWVVAGAHSASGGALLANDPHLGAQIPSIWYLAELHGDRLHAVGATLPGAPGIVLGRNRDIAWGATNLNPDVQDLFLERIDPRDPRRYLGPGGWSAIETRPERIAVKDGETIEWNARATRNGPLISDVLPEAPAPLALRWTALDPDDTTMDAFLAIGRARDWRAFTAALERYVTPSQSFVYADAAGHIGYLAPGRIPIRRSGDGRLPMPGWEDEAGWRGYLPFEALPRAFDPPAGFIATANNKPVGDDYPHHLGSDWAPPYRAERIGAWLRERIAAGQRLTVEDLRRLQGDQLSLQAAELLPYLRSLAPADARQAAALELLAGWDGRMERASAAAALYQAWLRQLPEALLADELQGELLSQLLERRHPVFLARILAPGEPAAARDAGGWCDDVLTPPRETCDAQALRALDRALDDLEDRLGAGPGRWRWGVLHQTQFAHNPFSEVDLLRPFFHRRIENGGDPYTVNVANVDLGAPYDQVNVPSYRQLSDLGAPDQSLQMHSTGQSGHPLSRHYDDLIERHRDLDYLPMRLSDTPPEGDRLLLVPAPGSGRAQADARPVRAAIEPRWRTAVRW